MHTIPVNIICVGKVGISSFFFLAALQIKDMPGRNLLFFLGGLEKGLKLRPSEASFCLSVVWNRKETIKSDLFIAHTSWIAEVWEMLLGQV